LTLNTILAFDNEACDFCNALGQPWVGELLFGMTSYLGKTLVRGDLGWENFCPGRPLVWRELLSEATLGWKGNHCLFILQKIYLFCFLDNFLSWLTMGGNLLTRKILYLKERHYFSYSNKTMFCFGGQLLLLGTLGWAFFELKYRYNLLDEQSATILFIF